MEKNKIIYIQNLNTDIDNLYNELLKESITYYENYKETLCDIGCSQNVTREYYDDKKRLLIGVSSDGTEFNPDEISGITVYDYQDNGDIIKESIFTFAVDIFYSL